MREFLLYIHSQLSRMTLIRKSEGKLSEEDNVQLEAIRGSVSVLENFAEQSKDVKLGQIVEDLQYSINHMRVSFKAEAALKDAETNINAY
jgi:hypothetical protein